MRTDLPALSPDSREDKDPSAESNGGSQTLESWMPVRPQLEIKNMIESGGAALGRDAQEAESERKESQETEEGVAAAEKNPTMPLGEEENEENPDAKPEEIAETGGEAQQAKYATQVRTPTIEEIEEHRKTHLPYRSWCPICVRSRGKDLPHKLIDRDKDGNGVIGFDYFFLGDGEISVLPAIAARESKTKAVIGLMVPSKGLHKNGPRMN